MPAATEYPIKLDDVDKLVEKEKKARQQYIKMAWDYYKGNHKKPLKVTHGQPDDNVMINVSKILVDRGISMLFGQGIEFNLEGDESRRTEPEEYLEVVWNGGQGSGNKKLLQLNDIGLSGYVSGQPAIRFTSPLAKSRTTRFGEDELPRLINVDPAILFAFWKADDLETILWYSLYWSENNRQDIIYIEDFWVIRDLVKRRDWQVVNETPWEYAWPPILTWKNLPNPNEFYGVSDLDHADLNDKINFIASNTNRILQKHAHPRTIVIGATIAEIIRDAVGGLISIAKPPSEVSVSNLEMQSDLASSMKYLEELKAAFFSLGAGVDLTTVKDRLGQITNFGLRLLFKDALDRLILKRALYGEAIVEINRRILELGGYGPDNQTEIIWPEPLPVNRLEAVEAVERQTALGVMSKETAADKLGLNFEREQERRQGEAGTQDIGAQILSNLAFNRGQPG